MTQLRLVNIKNGKADLLVDEVDTVTGAAKCVGKIGTMYFNIKQNTIWAAINKKGGYITTQSMRIQFTMDENTIHLLVNDVITSFGYEMFNNDFDGRSIEKGYEDIKMLSHSFVEYFESFIQKKEECEL